MIEDMTGRSPLPKYPPGTETDKWGFPILHVSTVEELWACPINAVVYAPAEVLEAAGFTRIPEEAGWAWDEDVWFAPEEHPHFLKWLVKLEESVHDRVEASFRRSIHSDRPSRLLGQ